MFGIGDFARHGRVSVRMLRHYDAIGLLRPDRVDPASGYRHYAAGQLARLNRIIALKDLGFTLEQVRSILDEEVSAEQLRGMLRLRRAELAAAMAADAARLAGVEARLRTIESEGRMSTDDVVIKKVPAVRLAELTATAAGFEPAQIGPVIQPLYGELCRRLDAAGVRPVGSGIAYYEDAPEGGRDPRPRGAAGRGRAGRRVRLRGRRPAGAGERGDDRAPRLHGRRPALRADAGPLDRRPGPPVPRLPPGAVPGVRGASRHLGDGAAGTGGDAGVIGHPIGFPC